MNEKLRIKIITSDNEIINILKTHLLKSHVINHQQFSIEHTEDLTFNDKNITDLNDDLLLIDQQVFDLTDLSKKILLEHLFGKIPIIFFSEDPNVLRAEIFLKQGAQDFLILSDLKNLDLGKVIFYAQQRFEVQKKLIKENALKKSLSELAAIGLKIESPIFNIRKLLNEVKVSLKLEKLEILSVNQDLNIFIHREVIGFSSKYKHKPRTLSEHPLGYELLNLQKDLNRKKKTEINQDKYVVLTETKVRLRNGKYYFFQIFPLIRSDDNLPHSFLIIYQLSKFSECPAETNYLNNVAIIFSNTIYRLNINLIVRLKRMVSEHLYYSQSIDESSRFLCALLEKYLHMHQIEIWRYHKDDKRLELYKDGLHEYRNDEESSTPPKHNEIVQQVCDELILVDSYYFKQKEVHHKCALPIMKGLELKYIVVVHTTKIPIDSDEYLKFLENIGWAFSEFYSRTRYENELRESNINKEKFLGLLAHELRNPLSVIIPGFDYLQKHYAISGERGEYIAKRISFQLNQVRHLVEDLLDISRINHGLLKVNKAELHFDLILDEVILGCSELAKEKNIEIIFQKQIKSKMTFYGDHVRLSQVVMNILLNSIRHTPKNGLIHIFLSKDNVQIYLSIKDSGVGIPQEKRHGLFNAFVQPVKNRDGLGLGLYLAKKIISLHKGEISLAPFKNNEGAEFIIQLPYTQYQNDIISLQSKKDEIVEPTNFSSKLLIVDDNKDIVSILKLTLKKRGFQIASAYDGQAGLKLCRQYKPDLAILDIMMPIKDGFETVKEIKKDFPHLPTIAFTGVINNVARKKAFESGFDYFLSKNIETNHLVEIVETVCKLKKEIEKFHSPPHVAWVDDNEDLLYLIQMCLKKYNIYLYLAKSQEEFVSITAKLNTLDLVILDYNLKDHTGLELIENVFKNDAVATKINPQKVFFVTAHDLKAPFLKGTQQKFHFYNKPKTNLEIEKLIYECLDLIHK